MLAPNLFSFATSELSQDAFICWLAAWADPCYSEIDPKLHATSCHFIDSMFREAGKIPLLKIESVEVIRQFNHIDVLIIINNEHVIIVEDKTNTNIHSNQLIRYAEKVAQKFMEENIVKIFFKTGEQASYAKERKQGYAPFTRKHFLKVLQFGREAGVRNDIFEAFHLRLEEIEDSFQAYTHLPLEKWNGMSWSGFFTALRIALKAHNSTWDCDWNYVPNHSGGFMGCWSKTSPSRCPYWQFENADLTIKIGEPERTRRREIRTKWYKEILGAAKHYDAPYSKPKRFGSGNCMTIVLRKDGGIAFKKSGKLDMSQTVKNIIEAQKIVQHAIQNMKKE